jgi:hypothetical protein
VSGSSLSHLDFVNNQFPTQEGPQGERLTFDTKGEKIIFVERIAALPGGGLMMFSPSLRIHSSFIVGSAPSAHSQPLRGGKS